jgi:hypothetical protein
LKAILPLAALIAFVALAGIGNSSCYPSYSPNNTNNPPIIAGLPDQTITVGQTIPVWDLFTFASDTEDSDSDLTFSIDSQSNPDVINCYVTGNRFLECGASQKAGYSDVTVRVTDTCGLSSTDTLRITVQSPPPVNTPPMISGISDFTINVGQTITSIDLFGYAFDQQDLDSALVFSIDSQSDPSVISCSIASNRYVQCGTAQKAGFSDIIIRVTDTGGLSDTDIFRITVQGTSPPPTNTPPMISGIPDLTISVGQTISLVDLFAYASDAQDPDSALSFSIDYQSNPSVISCYITGNRYVGCGAGQVAGFSDITVRVTDTGGLSATDTFRITVQAVIPADHAPLVNSVVITPSGPQDTDTLTCTAQVSDQDGNLQAVQFKWFVNGGLDKTRMIYVTGSYATVQDTLDSDQSTLGDEVKCQATVFDTAGNQDTGFDTVTIQRQGCSVDVSNLEVTTDSNIRFWVRNTGANIQTVTYDIYIDGGLIQESSITLNPGEVEIIQKSYAFGIGSFVVKAKATSQCGATDSESITHDVLNPCPTPSTCPGPQPQEQNPRVDSVRITPSDPEEGDDLTCRIEVSDNDGDLDKVRVKWFIEGDLEETRTIYVSGSSDDVQDTLNTGWFGRGRDVRCEATVFDRDGNEDTGSDTVTIGGNQEAGCGVDVYSLQLIEDNVIRFRIRNTGDRTEDITYKIYLESNVFDQHTITLDDGESQTFEESFTFDIRDFVVKVKATADCGATDSEFLYGEYKQGACIAKYLDDYTCSGNWMQRRYQYNDCSTNWMNFEYYPSGCQGGYYSGGSCGVSIRRFEYQTSVIAGNSAYVTLEASNTANRQETITLSLWVDGQLKESFPSGVSQGSTALRTFYYYPSAGTHQILAKAETSCGSSDTRTATVTVFQSSQQPSPYPTPAPQPAPSLPTAVSIYPSSLDTSLCGAKFVTIDIHNSVQQVYTIQVTGVPSDWLSYQSQNIVDAGDRQLFVYVGPKDLGTYNIRLTVTAGTEGKTYQQDVSIFTTSCPQQTSGTGGWSITGSLIDAGKSPLFWIVLIIIAGAIVIFVGATRLKPDEEYYEPAYPYRRYRPLPKK